MAQLESRLEITHEITGRTSHILESTKVGTAPTFLEDQICHLLKNPLRKAEDQNSRKNKLELAAWAARENHKSQRAATKTSILKIKTNKASKNFKSIHPSTATS